MLMAYSENLIVKNLLIALIKLIENSSIQNLFGVYAMQTVLNLISR